MGAGVWRLRSGLRLAAALGLGTCQQNCKRREFKPQLETSLPRGAAEKGKDPGVGLFQKLARAWGFSEAGAKGSSHVNLSLWLFGTL